MAVVQVVGGLLRLSFGRPEPAGCAEGIPGLVPRGVAQLQRVVDDREGVACLVLAQPAQAGTDAREHGRADEVPRGEVDALDASVVIEQAVDAPALLPRVGVLVGLLVEARERRRYPSGVGALPAQVLEVLSVPALEQGIQLGEQAVAVGEPPVALQHLLHGGGVRQREGVDRVALAQGVGHRWGEEPRADVGGQGLARALDRQLVVLVELPPLLGCAGFLHVFRNGQALGALDGARDEDVGQAQENQEDREGDGRGYRGQDAF